MRSPESEIRPPRLQEIKDFIKNSPEAIEAELLSTKGRNPWLACLITRIFGLVGHIDYLKMTKGTEEIPMTRVTEIEERLKALKQKTEETKNQYGWDTPDELKMELLSMLENIV